MDTDVLLLLIVAVTAVLATFFTVVPILPGTLLVPAGAAACGLVAGWEPFEWWFWVAQAVLVAVTLAVDQVAQLVGVRRAGGSRHAMWGGAIGVFAGPFVLALLLGPLALLVGPPVGAVAGTLIGQEYGRSRSRSPVDRGADSPRDYQRLGTVALLAFAVGTSIKLVLVAVQVGFLYAAVRP